MKPKFVAIFLPFIFISGCSYYPYPNYPEQVHSLLTYTEPVSTDTLSILNSCGTINITPSRDENLSIDCQIIYTGPDTDDFESKTKNLTLTPQIENNVILLETLVNTPDYWHGLDINFDDDLVEVEYDIKIPAYIDNLRIINKIGIINIEDTTASLDLQQTAGTINCTNVSIVDFSNIFLKAGTLTLSCNDFFEVDNIFNFVEAGTIKFSADNLSNLNYLFNHVDTGTISCQLPSDKSSYITDKSFMPNLEFAFEKFASANDSLGSEHVVQGYRTKLLADKNSSEYENASLNSDPDQPLSTIVANSIDVGLVSIK